MKDTTTDAPIARLRGVSKRYTLGRTTVPALRDIDLEIRPARFTVISGPSGSGKSTLLHLLGAIDVPDEGEIEIAGRNLRQLSDDARSEFRAGTIGFVFQSFNLLPVMTALENVEYPLRLTLADARARRERARALLAAVGLAGLEKRRPAELSGGQRQRVAVARALANRPPLLLADEPTANLDRATGAELIALLRSIQRDTGTSVVFCSHDPAVLAAADDRVAMVDGVIQSISEACDESA
jgi:putative ABC transport system ATP-binding protein